MQGLNFQIIERMNFQGLETMGALYEFDGTGNVILSLKVEDVRGKL